MEVGKIAVELMMLMTVAIIAESVMNEESSTATVEDIPLDECCRYKCDVNCARGGIINETCAHNCLMHCHPDTRAQCCRYKCYVTCVSRGFLNQTCVDECVKNCPPLSSAALPSGMLFN